AMAAAGGLRLEGVRGRATVPVRAVARVDEVPGAPAVVLLAVKAGSTEAACRELLPRLAADSVVVSLQNGLCAERVAAIVGRVRTVGGVVGWGASFVEPGRVVQTSRGHFTLGEFDGRLTPRLAALARLLAAVEPVRLTTNITGALWTKLVINAATSTLGAVTGLTLGEMLARPRLRRLAQRLVAESLRVAEAAGIRLVPFGGWLDLRWIAWREGPSLVARLHNLRGDLLLRLAGRRYRRLRSVMLQDLERGRPTEVDEFNGVLVARGAAHGVPTPINAALVALVHAIERGERASGLDHLDALERVAAGVPGGAAAAAAGRPVAPGP
ncbi:MAG TPA: ketopantoate reductase family protein, partial [Thermodesulfobacteriota bacterium]|nr:ketopantoate reductase family protein [Thermodesulfobacteriota bacterium]